MRSRPSFALTAILTLALGIGANGTMFSVIEGVLLRPLPYSDSATLVAVRSDQSAKGVGGLGLSFPKFSVLRDQTKALSALGAFFTFEASVRIAGTAHGVAAARATSTLFPLLGIDVVDGRGFLASEDRPGSNVAIATAAFKRRFFGLESPVGRSLVVDGRPTTIVGVLPPDFRFPFVEPTPDLCLAGVEENSDLGPRRVQFGASYLTVLGRLAPGQTASTATTELSVLNRAYGQANPTSADASGTRLLVIALQEAVAGQQRNRLVILFATTLAVFLVACTNLVSLILAMTVRRIKELSIRLAIGAGRSTLFRQFLAEGAVITALGTISGALLTVAATRYTQSLPVSWLPRAGEIRINLTVLAFCAALGMVNTATFAAAPLLLLRHRDVDAALRDRVGSGARRTTRALKVLLGSEIAIAVLLGFATGLLTKSYVQLTQVSTGVNAESVTTFAIHLPEDRYQSPTQQRTFALRLLERITARAGVAAAATTHLPVTNSHRLVYVCPQGFACQGVGKDPIAEITQVSDGYFSTMGIPLRKGRYLDSRDMPDTPRVAVISESTAAAYFPGRNPVGEAIAYSRTPSQPILIVGVVGDVKMNGLGGAQAHHLYVPLAQDPAATLNLVVRSRLDAATIAADVRADMQTLDPDVAVLKTAAMQTVIAESAQAPRATAVLTALFAAIAVSLAAAGIYGLLSYVVGQRQVEIGIRLALGASPALVFRRVVAEALAVIAIGVAVGVAASLATARVLASLLFGTKPTDPSILVGVSIAIVAVSVLACVAPAWAASRLDPIVPLRET